jgi:hypothetical protein
VDEQYEGVEVTDVQLQGREIFDAQLVHRDRVDSEDLLADALLVVGTLLHVVKDDSLDVPEDDGQVVTEELDGLNLSLELGARHDDGLGKQVPFVYVINEDFIRELLIKYSSQVEVLSVVGQEEG